MMAWLKELWKEIRPNAKWDFIKWALYGFAVLLVAVGVSVWPWFLALSLTVRLLLTLVAILAVCCVLLFVLLIRERRRPRIIIGEHPPAFLIPREASTASARGEARTGATLSVHTLSNNIIALNHSTSQTGMLGLSVWIENVETKPVGGCELVLVSLGSYHPERKKFREPTFEPIVLVKSTTLEPEGKKRTSEGVWLARVTQTDHSEIELPAGKRVTTGGIWKAVFHVKAEGASYQDALYFKWRPGSSPTFVPPTDASVIEYVLD